MGFVCSRIFPHGMRIDSSNYDPVPAWAAGSQLVALNYQTKDLPYEINFGKFLENGQCGYVLKPDYMRVNVPVGRQSPFTLVLHIISGQQLPKHNAVQKGNVVNPFVSVHVNGPPPLNAQEQRTKTIIDNGFNPVWNEVGFVFAIIDDPHCEVI